MRKIRNSNKKNLKDISQKKELTFEFTSNNKIALEKHKKAH